MNTAPFVIERTYDAPATAVWQALTDNNKMKEWYFQLEDFKPVLGFEFSFVGGSPEKQYVHLCRITEVIPGKKLAYSWQYKDYPGESEVSFELFPEGDKTRLKLTHAGLHTFPQDNKDFARGSFEKGWTHITGTSLANYLEKEKV
ncbi:MAG: SRPBCC domain-containing protein [Bacteroidota bacterium]|nr:SRPBCC domain-containing protein [Bacteroidota bacterium]MDP4216485.1 SRPBCC domain-containing protein [Bacteroidota bacterium]MDP4246232.1 SRPBCC domain-containing protein [Bacteroidota bacterium]MDP4260610.1 SRPBCC domain-containing protein [Bacteroidota bacterium]